MKPLSLTGMKQPRVQMPIGLMGGSNAFGVVETVLAMNWWIWNALFKPRHLSKVSLHC
jgi:hypothetical protein